MIQKVCNALKTVNEIYELKYPLVIEELCDLLSVDVLTRSLNKDGYLLYSIDDRKIFVSSKVQNRHRKKFIIGHELGHLLMHSQDGLQCCSTVRYTPNHDETVFDQEFEANTFASELLLPTQAVAAHLTKSPITFDSISSLANAYDVSVTMTSIKCVQNSKSESELLLCYQNGKLSGFATAKSDFELRKGHLPLVLPVCSDMPQSAGDEWNVFDGTVSISQFFTRPDICLILLRGQRIDI